MNTIVLDGTYYAFRNWHAQQECVPSTLALALLQSIAKIIREDDYQSQIVVAWDGGSSRYRSHDSDYKSTRVYDDFHDPLWEGMSMVREMLPKLGVHSIQHYGVEADDFGYYYAHQALIQGIHTKLYATDRDWFISINESCSVLTPNTNILWTQDYLKSEYTLGDNIDFLLYKAILGDGADNITGINKNHDHIIELCNSYHYGLLDPEVKAKIDHNISLMRLDHIVDDSEIISAILKQESLTRYDVPIGTAMAPLKVPNYFWGVYGKYLRQMIAGRLAVPEAC